MSNNRVLILGGYGVFGSRLAEALIRDGRFEVLVAGRSIEKAQAFCEAHGGEPLMLDRTDPQIYAKIAELRLLIVVDASGPFQGYSESRYRLAGAAMASGAHYIDLSDDADFSAGICSLNTEATASGVAVTSGASSVPGLSSAAVEALSQDLLSIDLIESVILPGNRAPRGLSVVRAILAQVGRPLRIWKGDRWSEVPGWSSLRREAISIPGVQPLSPRWSSLIGAPDLVLFPARYRARTVLFRAGLELSLLHLGLAALGRLVRTRLISSLEPAARPLRWLAERLEAMGSDRGAMVVRIRGAHAGGVVERTWSLLAEAGDGPAIPALAAKILCVKAIERRLPTGARACLGEFDLNDVARAAAGLAVSFDREERALEHLFSTALGAAFHSLPEPVQDLHQCAGVRLWEGIATVERGRSILATLVCVAIGFPKEGEGIPVTVEMSREGDREIWRRRFADRDFWSELRLAGPPGSGLVRERFGPFNFEIPLAIQNGRLAFPVARGWFLGLPVPRWLLPVSRTAESAANGKAQFDVEITLPLVGRVVRYRGCLSPSAPEPLRSDPRSTAPVR